MFVFVFHSCTSQFRGKHHPGGNPGANLKSISHRCHLCEVAFVWALTTETIVLPRGCLQGGSGPGGCPWVASRAACPWVASRAAAAPSTAAATTKAVAATPALRRRAMQSAFPRRAQSLAAGDPPPPRIPAVSTQPVPRWHRETRRGAHISAAAGPPRRLTAASKPRASQGTAAQRRRTRRGAERGRRCGAQCRGRLWP